MFGMALMAKGKKSYINIGAVKLKEMNPNAIINKIKHWVWVFFWGGGS